MSGDIVTRSIAHWSEAGRRGMDAFYTLATDDYRHLAEARDWAGWLDGLQEKAGARSLRLLDVACGSGKFPNALVRHAGVAGALVGIDLDADPGPTIPRMTPEDISKGIEFAVRDLRFAQFQVHPVDLVLASVDQPHDLVGSDLSTLRVAITVDHDVAADQDGIA